MHVQTYVVHAFDSVNLPVLVVFDVVAPAWRALGFPPIRVATVHLCPQQDRRAKAVDLRVVHGSCKLALVSEELSEVPARSTFQYGVSTTPRPCTTSAYTPRDNNALVPIDLVSLAAGHP